MRFLLFAVFIVFIHSSCTVFKPVALRNARFVEREVAKSTVFSEAFTGFVLLDPSNGKTLASHNANRYFTPASNTKILTLAACLALLGDSVPALRYFVQDSFLVVKSTGDPTFLHPYFQNWRSSYDFLSNTTFHPVLFPAQLEEPRFGPGWAWEDYDADFQAEKTAFPIYGNVVQIVGLGNNQFKVYPPFLHSAVQRYPDTEGWLSKKDFGRREFDNLIWMKRLPREGEVISIPFRPPFWSGMLEDTLHRRVIEPSHYHFGELPIADNLPPWRTCYSTPLDTVLRRMMYQSDNFIAEQLLLVCAEEKFGVLRQDTLIRWLLDSVFADLPQRPKWVDGSGLSRYNLASPQSIATVLLKLWREQPAERILRLFPAGGIHGTIAEWYAGKAGQPYVFAKTGGMGGVHCLSGYVLGKSGKVLIFSFMHNNFVGSNRPWKVEMQRILEAIHERY